MVSRQSMSQLSARLPNEWDYLVVTASNERQARWYEEQLELRRKLGYLLGFAAVIVVPDTAGMRIGSGGSTILCLRAILRLGDLVPDGRERLRNNAAPPQRAPIFIRSEK